MKYRVAGFLTLIFAVILLLNNTALLSALTEQKLSAQRFLDDPELLIAAAIPLFLLLLGLFLVFTRTSEKTVSTEDPKETSGARSLDKSSENAGLLHFLSKLQEKGRLLDFVMDDIAPYSDEEVGQVARVVHQGVKEVLNETMDIEAVYSGEEGSSVSLSEGYNSEEYRLLGNAAKKMPLDGTVLHRGWKAHSLKISNSPNASEIVHPIEVEVA